MPRASKSRNRLLAALPAAEYQRLLPKLETFSLTYGETIYAPGDTIQHIYFPESGIVSLLSAVDENSTLEVGIVGNEGLIGLPIFLKVNTSYNLAIVQGPGSALKMSTSNFLAECRNAQSLLPALLQRYTHSLLTQISQLAVCNRFHQIEARLARWLLMYSDRMKTDEFKLTHKFLSKMLGVRREEVSRSANGLQKRQLITYSRGAVNITDRSALEASTCKCYSIIRNEEKTFKQV